jgi:hypothetical protein
MTPPMAIVAVSTLPSASGAGAGTSGLGAEADEADDEDPPTRFVIDLSSVDVCRLRG